MGCRPKQPGKKKSSAESAAMQLLPQWLPLPGDRLLRAADVTTAQFPLGGFAERLAAFRAAGLRRTEVRMRSGLQQV